MKKMTQTWWKVLFVVTLAQLVFTSAVLAQAAGLTVPATDTDALDLAKTIWDAVVTKQYALVVGPVVALIVFALRKWDLNIPKVGPAIDAFLNKPFVAFLLPTIVSALGGLGTALAAHQPVLDALKAVFTAAMSAVFTYIGIKKAQEQIAAGKAAADAIATKTDAIEELKKP